MLEITISGIPVAWKEIMIAEMAGAGFDSFTEGEPLTGYIPENLWDEQWFRDLAKKYGLTDAVSFTAVKPERKNWNELWEKNFHPVFIGNRCMVRAPFHEPMPGMEYDIVIEPKMSFGTGHHETTSLMISMLLEEEVAGRHVLDMGCGTGILAILAARMGAAEITAIDHDEWSFRNALDNILRNNTPSVHVIQGDAGDIPQAAFDLILANINRNVITEDIGKYLARMAPEGVLILSGFYVSDGPVIENAAARHGKRPVSHKTMNDWLAIRFI